MTTKQSGQQDSTSLPLSCDLSGTWGCLLDPDRTGIDQGWYRKTFQGVNIILPGTLNENHLGQPVHAPPVMPPPEAFTKHYDPPDIVEYWRAKFEYVGAAWYQREIEIPYTWARLRVELFLERTQQSSRVWVDDCEVGSIGSLCIPHTYDLSPYVTSGSRHRLTIQVDNSDVFHLGTFNHGYSMQSQTLWNGIIGKIELRAHAPVWVKSVQVYPDPRNQRADIHLRLANRTSQAQVVKLDLAAESTNTPIRHFTKSIHETVRMSGNAEKDAWLHLDMGKDFLRWDEFSPALYQVVVSASTSEWQDQHWITFGMREFRTSGTQFLLNDRPIFLRGNHDQMVFPLTGYPAMDEPAWERIYKTMQSYGLNFIQFHSWTPPEAAFTVADRMGMYVCNALPIWPTLAHKLGDFPEHYTYLPKEAGCVLEEYGNHPCFLMQVLGEETAGDWDFFYSVMQQMKQRDDRHLYSLSTGYPFEYKQKEYPDEDFVVALNGWDMEYCRLGYIDDHDPLPLQGNDFDFSEFLSKNQGKPPIATEIGEWCMYPDLRVIEEFTEAIDPLNFKAIRSDLEQKGLLDRLDRYVKGSARHCFLLYKEDIEANLRTQASPGFQLLMLHDFPGQATCTVGMVDVFWKQKIGCAPEEFRRFCSPTVPLARMPRRVYQNDQEFTARLEVAHYGPARLERPTFHWEIRWDSEPVFSGNISPQIIDSGRVSFLGEIRVPLDCISRPAQLSLVVSLPGTESGNSWDFWVYPATSYLDEPRLLEEQGIVIGRRLDGQTRQHLASGDRVLLLPALEDLRHPETCLYRPVFWSPAWIPCPEPMGLWVEEKHPALALFPTQFWANLQWMDLMDHAAAIRLDVLPTGFAPLVEVIPNWTRNAPLGLLFEARVGAGRLVVCSADLNGDLSNRLEARQLRRSLLAYMCSTDFNPKSSLTVESATSLFSETA